MGYPSKVPRPSPALPRPADHEEVLTQSRLVADLRDLGLRAGDRVMVHASLSAVGWLENGPETLINALQRVVTEAGLLFMPTFNHGAPFSSWGAGYYDPKETPSSSGTLSDHFWRLVDVRRSLSPTHPFAAWGRGAEELVSGHESATTVGPGSPLDKLAQQGGKLLHLGTGHEVTTAKHLAEISEGAKCLSAPPDLFQVRLGEGAKREIKLLPSWRYRQGPCPLTDEGTHLSERLSQFEIVGLVGRARSSLSSLRQVVAETRALLRSGAGDLPPCQLCPMGPSPRREGDWD